MADHDTPICDLIERLLSTGMSTSDVMAAARPTEGALLRTTTARASTPEDRKKWAGQKQRQRGASTRMSTLGLESKNQDSESNKGRKKEPEVDISPDGWPADFVDVFWKAFPPFRRQAKSKVAQKLARIRAAGDASWETIIGGVHKFAATNPAEYAPAPMVWLNDGRWDREYGPQNRGRPNGQAANAGNGRTGFSGIAAQARARINAGGDVVAERPAPEDLQPVNRR